MDVTTLCEGLAQVVTAGTGLRCWAFEPDSPEPPCAYVMMSGESGSFMEEPFEAFRDGLCSIGLTVRVLGSTTAGIERGVRTLAPYMGSGTGQSSSVLDAVMADTSLNGAIATGNVRPLSIGAPRLIETLGGLLFIGVDFPLRVYATRL